MRSFLFAVILGLCLGLAPKGAVAQSMIRDAEIEAGLRNLLMPILETAGLAQSIRVILLNDTQMNAFVRDARTIFITSGLMMALDEPAELQAVLAHEAAHIANGHLARRPENADMMSGASLLGLVGGLLAAGVTGDAGAGAGVAAGMASSAQRVFFSHTRAEEASADGAALRYLERAGVDPTAMARVLDRFAGQELLSTDRQDPYVRTHPLTRDVLGGWAAAVEKATNGRVKLQMLPKAPMAAAGTFDAAGHAVSTVGCDLSPGSCAGAVVAGAAAGRVGDAHCDLDQSLAWCPTAHRTSPGVGGCPAGA
ncbi:MAG: hypothetical protein EBZ27_07260, partial [Rhodobacteraceae bacterium]|nr:hypothetical protein [Paracoccaceae bacterium]